ncbi:Zn-dependent protease [Cryptosporidium felis]|nr:Zn-dependent protease [Cryptosporidium felis]
MIFFSLLGAFEPTINTNNLRYLLENVEKLTGKKSKFIKHTNLNENFILEGRHRTFTKKADNKMATSNESMRVNYEQVSTNSILELLSKMKTSLILENTNKFSQDFFLIGITSMDIYPTNDYEYAFGQSDPKSGTAVVSAYRLFQTKMDKETVNIRILKVVMHEYGHLMRLTHCKSNCIMSTICSLCELDKRTLYYCNKCLNQIMDKISSDSVKCLLEV